MFGRGVELFVGGDKPVPESMLDCIRDRATGRFLGPSEPAFPPELLEEILAPQSAARMRALQISEVLDHRVSSFKFQVSSLANRT